MGYASEKKVIENKWKKVRRILFFGTVGVGLILGVINIFCPIVTWKYRVNPLNTGVRAEEELRIHFIDVGQGDATFIELPDGKTMLIDGGSDEDDSVNCLLRYLYSLKIKTIDYLLLTHADSDHCGGLDEVLNYFSVSRIFMPYAKPTVNAEFAKFYQKAIEEECDIEYSSRKISLSTNGYDLQFLYPYIIDTDNAVDNGKYAEDSNESSAVVWLNYKGVSALFTGDAPTSVTERLINEDQAQLLQNFGVTLSSTEILKVSHHGSSDGTNAETLRYLGVKTAVISCGENNDYGHPSKEACDALVACGVQTYRTDKEGNIMIKIDKNGQYGAEKIS